MSRIQIDIKKVRTASYTLPSMAGKAENVKRSMSLLRWRIPGEVQDQRDIRNRVNNIISELGRVEEELNDIYKITEHCLYQYMNTEEKNYNNASKFE